MKMFSNIESNVLHKFKRWNPVSEKDEDVLNRYASIGFIRFGFDWDKMEETAKLTELGKKHL